MNVDSFWELIERSRQATSDPYARLRWLERRLAQQRDARVAAAKRWLVGGGLREADKESELR